MSKASENHELTVASPALPSKTPRGILLRPKQIVLVPELPPSGGYETYENIVTAKDLFSRYLFAYPTSNQDAKTIAEVIINNMTQHAYPPTTLI